MKTRITGYTANYGSSPNTPIRESNLMPWAADGSGKMMFRSLWKLFGRKELKYLLRKFPYCYPDLSLNSKRICSPAFPENRAKLWWFHNASKYRTPVLLHSMALCQSSKTSHVCMNVTCITPNIFQNNDFQDATPMSSVLHQLLLRKMEIWLGLERKVIFVCKKKNQNTIKWKTQTGYQL